eukprot:gnl/Dysnectes_brevis/348_a383_8915.p1 GENE.gnl/Dysnectes_brevis/348_a383_8915~~gnl/Dysnectes_brevis/348_a383_8915.p1  ORF type:complete len:220 (+),score=66.45 gnl/Dysnectes_brevis/348_a383_8915:51-710(+)
MILKHINMLIFILLAILASVLAIEDLHTVQITHALSPSYAQGSRLEFDAVSDNSIDPSVIIDIGEKIWQLVKDNHIVDISVNDSANVVPEGVSSFYDMEGWAAVPAIHRFNILYTAALGYDAVDADFVVSLTYGGSYEDAGHYLHAELYCEHVEVSTLFSFTATASVPNDPVNIGTTEDPIAATELRLDYEVKDVTGLFTHDKRSISFMVDGIGNITEI